MDDSRTVEHNHEPFPEEEVREALKSGVKTRASNSKETVNNIVVEEFGNALPMNRGFVDSNDSLRQVAQRARRRATDQTLKLDNGVYDSIESLRIGQEAVTMNKGTSEEEILLLFDSGPHTAPKRYLCFGSKRVIQLFLEKGKMCTLDGTFQTCPDMFYQNYDFCAEIDGYYFSFSRFFYRTRQLLHTGLLWRSLGRNLVVLSLQ